MKEQIIVIMMIPVLVAVYTVSVIYGYFKRGIELDCTIWQLLSIRMLAKLVYEYFKGFKKLNDMLDEIF